MFGRSMSIVGCCTAMLELLCPAQPAYPLLIAPVSLTFKSISQNRDGKSFVSLSSVGVLVIAKVTWSV
jgi:hypothetical protein